MKIFLIGMPQSGRTTVAKALCQTENYIHVESLSWIRETFREIKPSERPQQYEDEFHNWFTNRLKINPKLITEQISNTIDAYGKDDNDYIFVIDGLQSPRDFSELFDYNKDMVIFLNRTANQADFKDYQNVGVSVMRDYCFWLSSADLLPKERWLEYNFSIPGEDSDWVKPLLHKNSVYLVKSINKVISHLKEKLKE
jgi:adenylate kinase family enzyme